MTTQSNTQPSAPITLDEVFKLIEYWREHKHEYKGCSIPEDLWLKIFELERNSDYTGTQIRRTM